MEPTPATPPAGKGILYGRPKGEAFVWFAALGLSFGLAMVIGLLAIVFSYGLGAFWPHRIALITFDESTPTRYQGNLTVAGHIMSVGERDLRDLSPEELLSEDLLLRQEKEVFLGNRDAFGITTANFILGHVAEVEFPRDFMRVERQSGGTGIFQPIRLILEDGSEVSAESEDFRAQMEMIVKEARELNRRLNRLEGREIGRLSREQNRIENDLRYFRAQAVLSPRQEAERVELQNRLQEVLELQEPLQRKARELRARQALKRLEYRLGTGEVRSIAAGTMLHYTFPNQMNFLDRLIEFTGRAGRFISEYPREANTEGGIFPAIFGTVVMTLLMSIAVMPFGVVAAIYLREYANQGILVRSVRIAINNLAGVPSIVFGVFGLGFFIYFVGDLIDSTFFYRSLPTPTFGTGGILWASLTLALMTVPVVIVATEEALAAVSRGVREGSLACGASKWQTIQRLVLPASAPGILTGLILAMARGAGEVAPLILVGVVALAPALPIDDAFPFIHLDRKFMHLGFHIYDLGFQSPDSEATRPLVFATTMVLILLVIILNLAAILLRNHLRRKFAAATF